MDKEKIKRAVAEIIQAIGEDPNREGLRRTPERVAELYAELFSGVGRDPEEVFRVYTVDNYEEMVILKDIPFYSICEHHLVPFFGKVHIAYIPVEGRIIGASHIIDVVNVFSRRPTIQERLTAQIADFLYRNKALQPMGVLVVIEARHLCMEITGVYKPGTKLVSSAVRGYLRKPATRAEALRLMGKLGGED